MDIDQYNEAFVKSIEQISKHEGFRSKIYKCPAGFLTIGYGRNLETNGISGSEAKCLLRNDLDEDIRDLYKVFPKWEFLSTNRKIALADLRFWLGSGKFREFKEMINAIQTGEFRKAADEIWNSKLSTQSINRTRLLSMMMRNG